MGLDITAYSNLTPIDCVYDDDGEPIDPTTRLPIDDAIRLYLNEDFPGREEGLRGMTFTTPDSPFQFCAGAYGGYSGWRKALAQLAGYEPESLWERSAMSDKSVPFGELVNFSDCEGTIGPVASVKLARDFAEFSDKARQIEFLWPKYQLWHTAFDVAAKNGAVSFH